MYRNPMGRWSIYKDEHIEILSSDNGLSIIDLSDDHSTHLSKDSLWPVMKAFQAASKDSIEIYSALFDDYEDQIKYWKLRAEQAEANSIEPLMKHAQVMKTIEDTFIYKSNDFYQGINRLEREMQKIWLLLNRKASE